MSRAARRPANKAAAEPLGRERDPQLARIIGLSEELADSMRNFFGGLDQSIYGELSEIAEFITKARDEIRALRPNDLRRECIPSAGAELDAIVKDTETATNSIMSAAEAMLACGETDLEAYKLFVAEQAMAIFEACGFQDITGQRVTKVVNVLSEIEVRIASLASNLGVGDPVEEMDGGAVEETAAQRRRREQILNGPAIDGPVTSQDSIDAMFD
jgi:chemotaxis protein CheZ